MRGPACFTNSCPAESKVTINAPVYEIDGSQIGFRTEVFAHGDLEFPDLEEGAVAWTAKLALAFPPVDPDSVDLRLGGTTNQRPLVEGLDSDYSVDGQDVYLYYTPAEDDKFYVRYVAGPADDGTSPDGTVPVGTMSTKEVAAEDDAAEADAGYLLADGYSMYSIAKYPELYAFAKANDLLADAAVPHDDLDTAITVDPATTFVLKYLIPYSYGEQGYDPATGLLTPSRSATHRVQIKA